VEQEGEKSCSKMMRRRRRRKWWWWWWKKKKLSETRLLRELKTQFFRCLLTASEQF
jgi:hypothetical protein